MYHHSPTFYISSNLHINSIYSKKINLIIYYTWDLLYLFSDLSPFEIYLRKGMSFSSVSRIQGKRIQVIYIIKAKQFIKIIIFKNMKNFSKNMMKRKCQHFHQEKFIVIHFMNLFLFTYFFRIF